MVYILGIFVLFIIAATAADQWKLSSHRGMSRNDFVEQFRSLNIPDVIPAAVYDYYKSLAISSRFGVSPNDRYDEVFSAESEDIEDNARELTERLGIRVPVALNLRRWNGSFCTLRDMVLWLDWVRREHPESGIH